MSKLSKRPLEPQQFGHYVNNLWSAFTLMDTKEDIRLLFRDLFTHTEYKMFAKRLEVARRLLRGDSYQIIEDDLKVTAPTIAKINNTLAEKGDGLRQAEKKLASLEAKHRQRVRSREKNLESPFRQKFRSQQRTSLGTALKAGAHELDKAITKEVKKHSARKQLPL